LMARQIVMEVEEGLFAEMRVRTEFFARSAREAIFPKPNPFLLHFHVKELLKERAVTYAEVLNRKGRVLSHSSPDLIGEVPADPVTTAAREAEEPLLQRTRTGRRSQAYHLSAPITIGARRIGTVLIGFDDSSVKAALRGRKRAILAIAALATLL